MRCSPKENHKTPVNKQQPRFDFEGNPKKKKQKNKAICKNSIKNQESPTHKIHLPKWGSFDHSALYLIPQFKLPYNSFLPKSKIQNLNLKKKKNTGIKSRVFRNIKKLRRYHTWYERKMRKKGESFCLKHHRLGIVISNNPYTSLLRFNVNNKIWYNYF